MPEQSFEKAPFFANLARNADASRMPVRLEAAVGLVDLEAHVPAELEGRGPPLPADAIRENAVYVNCRDVVRVARTEGDGDDGAVEALARRVLGPDLGTEAVVAIFGELLVDADVGPLVADGRREPRELVHGVGDAPDVVCDAVAHAHADRRAVPPEPRVRARAEAAGLARLGLAVVVAEARVAARHGGDRDRPARHEVDRGLVELQAVGRGEVEARVRPELRDGVAGVSWVVAEGVDDERLVLVVEAEDQVDDVVLREERVLVVAPGHAPAR